MDTLQAHADETIGLRGYDNGSLAYNGYAYDRFTLELRYPFLLGNTTIYGLGFVEAGTLGRILNISTRLI